MGDSLTYDDLNRLVTYNLITEAEAIEIDEEYDYNAKLDLLMEQGLIVGDTKGVKVERGEGDGNSTSVSDFGSGKIHDGDKQRLYLALDDEFIEFELTSKILRNYNLVVFPKLRIALMEPNNEGDGASYVMSIKLALDQIVNNEKSDEQKDVDPLKAYSNRTGIRSIPGMETVYHVETWGKNLEKKMKKIHSNLEDRIYSKDKDETSRQNHRRKINSIQEQIVYRYRGDRLEALKHETLN